MKGIILVNFKCYEEGFGEGAVKLAKICKKVAEKTGVRIVPVVSALEAYRIQKEVGGEVWLQHIDGFETGAKSGYISGVEAQKMGITGSLINHSEKRLKPGTIKKMLKSWPKGFESAVCVQTLGQTERWAKKLKTDWVAYEPKELIGNKEKSVSTEKPDMIKKMVEKYSPIGVLVGAGIHQKSDVEIALKLGAKGILVASDVVKAKDPEAELSELALGFL